MSVLIVLAISLLNETLRGHFISGKDKPEQKLGLSLISGQIKFWSVTHARFGDAVANSVNWSGYCRSMASWIGLAAG
jgi:hypothetical protein